MHASQEDALLDKILQKRNNSLSFVAEQKYRVIFLIKKNIIYTTSKSNHYECLEVLLSNNLGRRK